VILMLHICSIIKEKWTLKMFGHYHNDDSFDVLILSNWLYVNWFVFFNTAKATVWSESETFLLFSRIQNPDAECSREINFHRWWCINVKVKSISRARWLQYIVNTTSCRCGSGG
jgi:hypothetical protein